MALTQGTRLGAYEILSPAGAGGMGEVYRARDTRLDLFFVTDNNQLMAAPYTTSGDSFVPGTPKLWNVLSLAERGATNINYALHPDGDRAAVVENYSPSGSREPLRPTFVFNFLREVQQKLAEMGVK